MQKTMVARNPRDVPATEYPLQDSPSVEAVDGVLSDTADGSGGMQPSWQSSVGEGSTQQGGGGGGERSEKGNYQVTFRGTSTPRGPCPWPLKMVVLPSSEQAV